MKNAAFVALAALFLCSSCFFVNRTKDFSLSDAIADHTSDQVFTFQAANGAQVTGDQGTIISIPPGSFRHLNGTPVTGTVELLLREYYNSGDMFFGGITTSVRGVPLISGGTIFVDARQGTDQLLLAPFSSLGVTMPKQTMVDGMASNMTRWTGVANGIDITEEEEQVTWTERGPVDTDSAAYVTFIDSIGLGNYVNCDVLVPGTNRTQFTVEVRNAGDNFMVFLFPDNITSVIRLTLPGEENQVKTYVGSIPVGMEGTLVAISGSGEDLRFGSVDFKVVGDDLFEIKAKLGTVDELEALIAEISR